MACPKPGCTADPCCRIEHHGGSIAKAECPRCGLRPGKDHIRGMPVGTLHSIIDCSLAAGVVCGRCGHYWEPKRVPRGVRAEAKRVPIVFGARWKARREAVGG